MPVFTPALGLGSGHAQTLFAARLSPRPDVATARHTLRTPDADFIDVDVLAPSPGAPCVLLLHGLEGSSRGRYMRRCLEQAQQRGWGAVAVNFRSCSGRLNHQAKAYSSSDFADVLLALTLLPTTAPRFAIGFSLGASVLLNLLAKAADQARLDAAVTVSAPYELDACATWLDSSERMARVYLQYFLPSMKAKSLAKAAAFPRLLDAERIRRVRTLREFDAAVTAPLFGFSSAEDYYARSSAGPQLRHIDTPTLLISAHDDALAPAGLAPANLGRNMEALFTKHGGHVAFIEGSALNPKPWAERQAFEWLAAR